MIGAGFTSMNRSGTSCGSSIPRTCWHTVVVSGCKVVVRISPSDVVLVVLAVVVVVVGTVLYKIILPRLFYNCTR